MRIRTSIPARVLLASCVAVFGAVEGSQAQTAQICLVSQLQYAGTSGVGFARCYQKAMKHHLAVDPACLTGQSSTLASRFTAAEAASSCLVEPAGSDVNTMVSPVIDGFVSALGIGNGKCAVKKLGALARDTKQRLRCYAQGAAASSTVNPACLDAAQTRAGFRFGRLEATGSCVTTGDFATLEPQAAALGDNVFILLRGAGTTTTSTTTTVSTTTTTTLPPGTCADNGAFEPCFAYRDIPACKACVDATTGPDAGIATTLCTGAGPVCNDAYKNAACGYAINTGTSCGMACCP